MPGDPLHGGGQAAIAFSNYINQLVDLPGRLGRGLDLDPAADALEDRRGIKGIGYRHVVSDTASFPIAQFCNEEMMAYSRIRNSQTVADENQR
jgi:hypothetical protein